MGKFLSDNAFSIFVFLLGSLVSGAVAWGVFKTRIRSAFWELNELKRKVEDMGNTVIFMDKRLAVQEEWAKNQAQLQRDTMGILKSLGDKLDAFILKERHD